MMQNGKPPSFSDAIEFEECLVGALMLAPEKASEVHNVRRTDFFDPELSQLYALMLDSPPAIASDTMLLIAEAQIKKLSITSDRIANIFTKVPNPHNVRYYAKQVVEFSHKRRLFKLSGQLLRDSTDQSKDAYSIFEELSSFSSGFEFSSGLGQTALSFSELQDEHGTQRVFLIDGILREREILGLVAATKIGKSFMALDLGMSLATGRQWLKSFDIPRPQKVLFIDGELHHDTFFDRMDCIQYSRRFDVEELDGNFNAELFRGKDKTDIRQLEREYFPQFSSDQVDFIVIDCLYKFMPAGWSENDHGHMADFIEILDRIAESLNSGICVVHHSSKGSQGAKNQIDIGSGAGTFQRAVDTLVTIRPHKKDGYCVMESASRSMRSIEPASLFYSHPCWNFDQLEKPVVKQRESLSEANKKKEDQEAIEQICALGEFNIRDIRTELGCGEDRANRLRNLAKKQSLIEEVGMVKRKQSKTATMVYRTVK